MFESRCSSQGRVLLVFSFILLLLVSGSAWASRLDFTVGYGAGLLLPGELENDRWLESGTVKASSASLSQYTLQLGLERDSWWLGVTAALGDVDVTGEPEMNGDERGPSVFDLGLVFHYRFFGESLVRPYLQAGVHRLKTGYMDTSDWGDYQYNFASESMMALRVGGGVELSYSLFVIRLDVPYLIHGDGGILSANLLVGIRTPDLPF